ncbi:MAG: STAS domain-containing protein, partial [Burkholderiales bacterium]|nr:STAS domain-containing protein [Burkholderiales bacterium]
ELDLSGLTHFDSTAVAVLIALRREAPHGPAFRGVPANLRKLAGLYGVETLLFGPNA